ncbi:MAG: MoxR family ATPase [Planctomycetaceae bacterium]|nr:MoxR family ATPase [Planctomycetaceae bacterium]
MSNAVDQTLIEKLISNVGQVILGKRDVVELCMIALVSGEHVLLEDVPGVGKTSLGRALSKSVAASFARIQFTPDLLPADIVGSSVFNQAEARFEFHPGPIFHNFVLGDEINRAPPRTQAALLEAMSDRQVSIDGVTRELPAPFMVIATQNPFEFEGTYSLPESQLDRFLMRISVGYPDPAAELQILESQSPNQSVNQLPSVLTREQVMTIQQQAQQITFDQRLKRYLLEIVHRTRQSRALRVGVSTRGALHLQRAAQSRALVQGRNFVIPDDIKLLAIPTLAHRVLLSSGGSAGNNRRLAEEIMNGLLDEVAVP